MASQFDKIIDRRHTESGKWHRYDEDVLPLWVADMDFRSPEPVIQALQERVAHGIFGYGKEPPRLREVFVQRMATEYDWHITPEDVTFVPGVVVGFNQACHAYTSPGDGVLLQTPVYYPMLNAPPNAGLANDEMVLTLESDGTYSIDFDAFEAAITERTRIFILCNPHNPVGRVFRRDELERMAEICLRHDVLICSDEIHCDLVLSGHKHVPIAALSPEIASKTVTLMAPSKTFNIAGFHFSVAIIQDPELRKQYMAAPRGMGAHASILSYTAALAAYEHGGPWLAECLRYMEANCDYLQGYLAREMPGIKMAKPEGTYLAWLDCRNSGIPGNPAEFFLEKARVAMNDGAPFGKGGEGFVRLNFGCPRSTLEEALGRMTAALQGL
jgi:cysteine-S-conjugate beta-lyase